MSLFRFYIHSFKKYLLSTNVPGNFLRCRECLLNIADINYCPRPVHILSRKVRQTLNKISKVNSMEGNAILSDICIKVY